MTRLLVTGGRAYRHRSVVEVKLNQFHYEHPDFTLAHGDADGLDRMARDWAKRHGVKHLAFPIRSDIGEDGFGRNKRMFESFWPTHVMAFPGGSGTADMCRIARAYDVIPIRVL